MGKGKKWLIGCVGTLALCGVGTYVAVSPYVDFIGAARDLDKQVERAKKLGNPMTSAELIPLVPADKDNAAIELEPILRGYEKAKLNDVGSEAIRALAENNFAHAETLIAPHQGALAIARKAVRKPNFVLERDWDLGSNLLFPEYAASKGLTRLLAAQARLDFRKGNIATGGENLQAGYRMGEFIGNDPTLLGMAVEIGSRAIVSRMVESIAVENRTRESVLSTLESAVGNRPAPDFNHALRGEMFMGTTTIRNLDKYGGFTKFMKSASDMNEDGTSPPLPALNPNTLRREGLPPGILEKAFLARHLAVWNDALEQMQKTPDPREFSKWLDDRYRIFEEKKALSYMVWALLFPVFESSGEAVVRCKATEGATRGFLKVLRFKAKTGRYPKDLAEAGFKEIDPFSKEPYKFYLSKDIARVYSVGPNGKDEEGLGPESRPDKSLPDQLDDVSVRTDRPAKFPPLTGRAGGSVVPPAVVPKVK